MGSDKQCAAVPHGRQDHCHQYYDFAPFFQLRYGYEMKATLDILHTSYLESCIDKKRALRDIHEALGLFSEISCKTPVFTKDAANELQDKVKETAKKVRAKYRKDPLGLKASLLDDASLARDVDSLMSQFGKRLWGRPKGTSSRYTVSPGEVAEGLRWEVDADKQLLGFYVRCWIIRHAVDNISPGTRKDKRKGRANNNSGRIITIKQEELECEEDADLPASKKRKFAILKASTAKGKSRNKARDCRSPTSSTRAVEDNQVQKDALESPATLCSPVAADQYIRIGVVEVQRRGEAEDFPQEDNLRCYADNLDDRSVTLGPIQSCADSRGCSPDHVTSTISACDDKEGQEDALRRQHTHTANGDCPDSGPSDLPSAKKKGVEDELSRLELFTLLLSYIHGIDQFGVEHYQLDAEARMNTLLNRFCTEGVVDKKGSSVPIPEIFSWWMQLRAEISKFRAATTYFGRPGEDWKAHLRTLEGSNRARANIAYANLRTSLGPCERMLHVQDFSEDLAKMFDALTQVDGCNGPQEFQGIRGFNAKLLAWLR